MIPILSTKEIKEAEKSAIEKVGEEALINRASSVLALRCLSLTLNSFVIFAGSGNNGSDALFLAEKLLEAKKKVSVYASAESKNIYNLSARKRLAGKGIKLKQFDEVDINELKEADCVIDGILGIGLNRPLEGLYKTIVELINEHSKYTLAVDICSGLDSDSGSASIAVKANETITFSALKPGQFLGEGKNYSGKVILEDIGIEIGDAKANLLEEKDILMPTRPKASHKGNYGAVRIIAGSPEMMGASLLAHEAALAALRSGAGYAVLCVPKSLASIYMGRVKEEMLNFLPDDGGKILFDESALSACLSASSIVVGPGLGRNKEILKIIGYFSNNYSGTLIIDADGLNVLSEDISVIGGHKCKLILTPHLGEFKRLSGNLAPTIENAKALALKTGSVVVLKSSSTIITDRKIAAINTTGGPELAKGGSGDVLSGMIGAFSSRFDPFGAACRACWYFGKAGEKAAERMGENSVLASDICGIIREE